ncbi:unnamed protein product [Effrenium voratum]|nr:unnamed protein product [Effrenium voratum]
MHPTHLAKVREWATKELLHTANPQEMEILLQEKVRCLAPADQRALVRQLLHLGGLDEGTKHPELQLAESHLGPLSAKAEDPFRALAHSLHLTARQLAALTALDLRRCKLLPKSGQLLERCMQCLEQQQPLPPESGTWPEVQEVLEAVVRAVPLHVELHELSNLGEPRVFSPKVSQNRKAKRVEDMRVKLMYLPASKSLHAAAQKTAPQETRAQRS